MDAPPSPALSLASNFSDMTDEELDKYFASYVPLSNLPTPPPAKESIANTPSSNLPLLDAEVAHQSPELEVHATQLSKLIPANVSPQRISIPTARGILERANLPIDVVAFAGCILDALSQRFASSWRTCLTPEQSPPPYSSKFHLAQPSSSSPELILLSALALAHDFIDDRSRTTKHWSQVEGRSLFSIREIDATKFCILKDMDYGLFRITDAVVDSMIRDLQRAGDVLEKTVPTKRRDSYRADKDEKRPRMSIDLHDAAVWVHGMPTPEPSP